MFTLTHLFIYYYCTTFIKRQSHYMKCSKALSMFTSIKDNTEGKCSSLTLRLSQMRFIIHHGPPITNDYAGVQS